VDDTIEEAFDGLRSIEGGGEAKLILLWASPPAELEYPEEDDTDSRLLSSVDSDVGEAGGATSAEPRRDKTLG
jgi:hypothetical protein